MQLKEYLEQLSPSNLKKIMTEQNLDISSISPNELVKQLVAHLNDSNKIPLLYSQMTKSEKEVLEYFIIQIPNQILLYRRLEKSFPGLTRDEFEYGLTKLRRKGLIFTLRRGYGEIGYLIPDDLFLMWHRYFFRQILTRQYVIEDGKLEQEELANATLEENMFRFLAYLELEDITITQKGTIPKRNIAKLSEELTLDSKVLENFPIKIDNYSREYPKSIAILLDFAFKLGLVELMDSLVITNKARVWHNLPLKRRKIYLQTLTRQQLRSSDLLIQQLFNLLFQLPAGKWYPFAELFRELAKTLNRPFGSELLLRAEKELIVPLRQFGWIGTIGEAGETRRVCRFEEAAPEITQIYVQANYEILVPKTYPDHLRLVIEHFAKLEQRDQMSKYVLSKETVLRGLQRGKKLDELLEILTKYSVIPLAENVRYSLEDWAKNFGTISLMDIRIMKCKTEALAADLQENLEFKEWIIGELTPGILIVKRTGFPEFLQKLQDAGYYPDPKIWTESDLSAQQQTVEVESQIELFADSELPIENIFPSFAKSQFFS